MKSSPTGIAIIAVTIVVPIIVAIVIFSFYLDDKANVSTLEQEIVRCQTEIEKLSGAVELYESLVKKKSLYGACLSEVKSSISKYIQWSPVLVTIVENMPDEVILTGLEVRHESLRKKVPKLDDPKQMVEKSVPIKVLIMNVSGDPKFNCGKAVRDFQDSLRSSAFLGPKIESIGYSQESEMLKGQNVASYEIKCVFKENI